MFGRTTQFSGDPVGGRPHKRRHVVVLSHNSTAVKAWKQVVKGFFSDENTMIDQQMASVAAKQSFAEAYHVQERRLKVTSLCTGFDSIDHGGNFPYERSHSCSRFELTISTPRPERLFKTKLEQDNFVDISSIDFNIVAVMTCVSVSPICLRQTDLQCTTCDRLLQRSMKLH
ncbi:hypothetical protein BDZ45DRAFT_803736 [Acephala macrosclerotiorum]|nr:hypothetical protein BDZ45DRAFT_803736 [Acephala macrosclerotiorum]